MTTSTTSNGIEIRPIRPHELIAWASLAPKPERALKRLADDPQAELSGVFVAADGENLLAGCRVMRREIYLSGRRIRAGIVDEMHGQDGAFGQTLLERAAEYLRAQGIAIALWTGRVEGKCPDGWQEIRFLWRRVRFPAGQEDVREMRGADMARVRGLYGLWAGAADGLFVREHPEHWDKWICAGGKNPCLLWEDGQPVAYADWEEKDGAVRLRDWAQLPGRSDLPGRLLGCLANGREALVPERLSGGAGEETDAGAYYVRLLAPLCRGEIAIDDTQALVGALSRAVILPIELD